MVTRASVIVAALASVAHAEPPMIASGPNRVNPHPVAVANDPPPRRPTMLGTRMGFGLVPVGEVPMTTASIGVSIDHHGFGEWRLLGEYEFIWIGPSDLKTEENVGVASLPNSGHRANVGFRRRLDQIEWSSKFFSVFVDLEAGAGAMLVDQRPSGSIALPHVFAGFHAGMALQNPEGHRWEYEIVLRGLALPDGPGVLFGIGLVWGD